MEKEEYVRLLGERAKAAARVLSQTGETTKNYALETIAGELLRQSALILEANRLDMEAARQGGMRPAMLDRLRLDEQRIADMADALGEVVSLPDPVGQLIGGRTLANGLNFSKVRVPLGVVGIIYESRPNVTVDAAALCIKAGNAALLRGGKEAVNTNKALAGIMAEALATAGLPRDCVLLIEDTDRECTNAMMRLNGLIDVLIPRGGAGLIASVVENATVPVIETGVGNCHLYIDSPCDRQMAIDILVNAKCSRPSVCNAVETLLVHRELAEELLPRCKEALDKFNVELRGCPETRRILGYTVIEATDEDFSTEFSDYILAVRVVEDIDEALEHIARYSTGHSEAIVTSDYHNSRRFTAEVDSAAVYVNASTRFTDGSQLGMGAEIGISTQKLHARGPMGLDALTTLKYIVLGDGQIRI